jgi:hypothetical protein
LVSIYNEGDTQLDIPRRYWQLLIAPAENGINRCGKLTTSIQSIRNAGYEKVGSGTIRRRNKGMLEDRSQVTIQKPAES